MLLAFVAGCNGEFSHNAPRPGGSRVSSPSEWEIDGDLAYVERAIDQNPESVAMAMMPQQQATVTVDLGKACLFNTVVVSHGLENQHGYVRRLAVSTSLDGKTFSRRYVGSGTRRKTILPIITPVLARYVRLEVLQPGDKPWAIAEIFFQ